MPNLGRHSGGGISFELADAAIMRFTDAFLSETFTSEVVLLRSGAFLFVG